MRKYGFNMQWMFISSGYGQDKREPAPPNLRELDFIAKRDFNFIRVPLDYRFWTNGFDYLNPNEKTLEIIDTYLEACRERGLHMCINMHRAPGFCVNNNLTEKHNLWTDIEAQDGFVFIWEYFAKKYKGISSDILSFNLLNEPKEINNNGLTRNNHEKIMRRTINAIRAIDPSRQIIIDGYGGGDYALPELADTNTVHSGRGYAPWTLSHYKADWMGIEYDWADKCTYPHLLDGVIWDKAQLKKHYEPWREVERQGVKVFKGEIGSYNNTPNDVFLKWMADVLDIYREYKWGYALWQFNGSYGVVDHGKPGGKYEVIDGFNVDRALLEMLMENRGN